MSVVKVARVEEHQQRVVTVFNNSVVIAYVCARKFVRARAFEAGERKVNWRDERQGKGETNLFTL